MHVLHECPLLCIDVDGKEIRFNDVFSKNGLRKRCFDAMQNTKCLPAIASAIMTYQHDPDWDA
jgi:hypothetical protein